MKMIGRIMATWLLLFAGLANPLLSTPPAATATKNEPAVFAMREVSIFSGVVLDDYQNSAYLPGQSLYHGCNTKLDSEVKRYPVAKSEKAVYGTIHFDGNFYPLSAHLNADVSMHFMVDESEGTDKGYDRLYLDANHDLNLTNDLPLGLMKDLRSESLPLRATCAKAAAFECFDATPVFGYKDENRSLQLFFRLEVHDSPRKETLLVCVPTVFRQGKIAIGPKEYDAVLSQAVTLAGRFDQPSTTLLLKPVEIAEKTASWRVRMLCEVQQIDGHLYRVSATPSGDRLTVTRYDGEFGVLEFGRSGKEIERLAFNGRLLSQDGALFTMGTARDNAEKQPQHKLPAGNYWLVSLGVDYSKLAIEMAPIPENKPGNQSSRPAAYPIKIRSDKPYILEFSPKAKAVFRSPPPNLKVKPGDTVQIEAILTDPALGMMFASLTDSTRKTGELHYRDEKGTDVNIPRYAPIQPIISITDSSGKEVTNGEMPFG